MRLDVQCVACDLNQSLKVMELIEKTIAEREQIISKVLERLSRAEYDSTNPELLCDCWKIVRGEQNNFDPYLSIKQKSNEIVLKLLPTLKEILENSQDSFQTALKFAIFGNMIDFAAFQNIDYEMFAEKIRQLEQEELSIDDSKCLYKALSEASNCLYVADNCGEAVLDKLFIEQLKKRFPKLHVYYVVRGEAVINDVTRKEAEQLNVGEFATIIDNDTCMPGLVPKLLKDKEKAIYNQCEVVISKGQGNFEGLSSDNREGVFYLFVAKCKVIQQQIKLNSKGMVCMKSHSNSR